MSRPICSTVQWYLEANLCPKKNFKSIRKNFLNWQPIDYMQMCITLKDLFVKLLDHQLNAFVIICSKTMTGWPRRALKFHARQVGVLVVISTIFQFMDHRISSAAVNIVIKLTMLNQSLANPVIAKSFNHCNHVPVSLSINSMNKGTNAKKNYRHVERIRIVC